MKRATATFHRDCVLRFDVFHTSAVPSRRNTHFGLRSQHPSTDGTRIAIGTSKSLDMLFRQLFDPQSATYTYLLADDATRDAALIDPVLERVDRDLELVTQLGFTLARVSARAGNRIERR